jgi:hypothetical protein
MDPPRRASLAPPGKTVGKRRDRQRPALDYRPTGGVERKSAKRLAPFLSQESIRYELVSPERRRAGNAIRHAQSERALDDRGGVSRFLLPPFAQAIAEKIV